MAVKKIVINASNLHVGGGVQVATSFIYEVALIKSIRSSISVFTSSDVHLALQHLNTNLHEFAHYEVIDNFGLNAYFSSMNEYLRDADVCFTIFGPNYLRVKAKTEIVGFAQAWMLHFDNPISQKMSAAKRTLLRFKFYLQWLFFKRSDHYIVELDHVKKGLIDKKGLPSNKISVVHNCVSSIYIDSKNRSELNFKPRNGALSIGIVSRDYPHKNIGRLSEVAQILDEIHQIKAHFYVTLNDEEWIRRTPDFKKNVTSVGALSPEQCPAFYEKLDAVIFPSLLECFSATPLEAMVMGKPLFASNRGFVRDVCADHAFYFDPLDSNDIAKCIANYFDNENEEFKKSKLLQAREHALGFSSAAGRAEQYLKIITQQFEGKPNAI